MTVFIFSLIGVILFYGAIRIVNRFDQTANIKIKNNFLIVTVIIFSTLIIYLKYGLTLNFIFIFYLSIYLIVCAYIDFKTMFVYSIFNFITIVISVIYLYLTLKITNFGITNLIINVIIYMVFSFALSKFNVYGEGDSEIFIAISIFIAIKYNVFIIETLLINMVLSNIVAIFMNIKNIDFKKMKLKNRIAFAPCIAISTMILLVI